jgi:LysM repeat protein
LFVAGWHITAKRLYIMFLSRFALVASLFALIALSACAPNGLEVVGETDEKQYQLAKDYQGQGRTAEALSAFLRVIDARRDAPESHFEAGYIYLNSMKDPVKAIYHFDRYLQFKPQSPQATQVRQLIETAQKEFARQLPDSITRDLAAAQQRVQQLENVVGGARRVPTAQAPVAGQRSLAPTQVQAVTPTSDPASAPRSYTVKSGDSLSSISRAVYGTPSRWIDIYQANRDRLSSENALKVGQDLRIP